MLRCQNLILMTEKETEKMDILRTEKEAEKIDRRSEFSYIYVPSQINEKNRS